MSVLYIIVVYFNKRILLEVLCRRWFYFVWTFSTISAANELDLHIRNINEYSFVKSLANSLDTDVCNIEQILFERVCNIKKLKQKPYQFGVVVYGLGEYCHQYFLNHQDKLNSVICFCDSNDMLWGKQLLGKDIVPPMMLPKVNYDFIEVGSTDFFDEIIYYLKKHYHINSEQLISLG